MEIRLPALFPGNGHRAPGRQAEKGKSGAAGLGGSRVHGGSDAAAVGLLVFGYRSNTRVAGQAGDFFFWEKLGT